MQVGMSTISHSRQQSHALDGDRALSHRSLPIACVCRSHRVVVRTTLPSCSLNTMVGISKVAIAGREGKGCKRIYTSIPRRRLILSTENDHPGSDLSR